jgi:hypothetical protein
MFTQTTALRPSDLNPGEECGGGENAHRRATARQEMNDQRNRRKNSQTESRRRESSKH